MSRPYNENPTPDRSGGEVALTNFLMDYKQSKVNSFTFNFRLLTF